MSNRIGHTWAALWRALALVALSSLAFNAAAKTLILTTDEVTGAYNATDRTQATNLLDRVVYEFSSPTVTGASVTEMRGALTTAGGISASTFTDSPGPYDLVVVVSIYKPISSTAWSVLTDAVNNHLANAFVFFVDGCCNTTATAGPRGGNGNVTNFVTLLNATTGQTLSVGANQAGMVSSKLNTTSTYSGDFTGLNPLVGGWVTYLQGVPYNNNLYLPAGVNPVSPAPATLPQSYGFLFPQTEMSNGQGACLFGVVDSTLFDPSTIAWNANRGKIGPAFTAAAEIGSTSCKVSPVTTTTPVTPVTTVTPVPVPVNNPTMLALLGAALLALGAGVQMRRRG